MIPADVLDSVAFLCVDVEKNGRKQRVPIATVFFVEMAYENIFCTYLVTARHCVEDPESDELFVRINDKAGRFRDILTKRSDWRVHKNADVAILFPSGMPTSENLKYRTIPSWSFVGPGPDYIYSGPPLPTGSPGMRMALGLEVYFVGLFSQHYGRDRNLPIARFGHISRLPDRVRLKRDRGATSFETTAYLVESQSWGGHSGSPAFFRYPMAAQKAMNPGTMIVIGNCVGFLGLVSAHYPISTEAKTTGDILGKLETELNSGISVVTPAEAVRQLLMEGDFLEDRKAKQIEADKDEPIPSMDSNAALGKLFTQDDFEAALKKASRKIEPKKH